MSKNKKIAIIVDTNIYTPSDNTSYDLTDLPLKDYYNHVNLIKELNLEDKVDILIPEVVLLELLQHNKKRFESNKIHLKKINQDFINLDITIEGIDDLDYDVYFEKLKKKYYEHFKIICLPPSKKELFGDILNRYYMKVPPFEENDDKGFKDTLIFLSILNFIKKELYEKYVFFSEDNIFKNKKKNLKRQFNYYLKNQTSLTKCKFEIINNKDLDSYIKNI